MQTLLHTPRSRFAATVALALFLLSLLTLPALARADEQLRGAAVHGLWSSSPVADSERELDILADAGANAIRLDISWSSLETEGKGRYSQWYVDKTDRLLRKAAQRNLKVVALLWSTPCWASAAPDTLRQGCAGAWWDRDVDRYAPRDMNDFADAAAWVSRRWGSQFAAIEIWNEPNLEDQYSLKAPDPAATAAALLRAAYPRVKQEAPALPVLAGVLSGSDGDFLERLYRHGIGGHFDGISIHPYTEWRDPDDPWKDEWKRWSLLKGVPWIHEIMRAHGDGDKGIWLTEFGYSTCGQGDRWCVSPQQQAEYIKDTFRIVRRWDYVKAALVYNLRNKGSDPSGREDQFGMLNRDFSPKPAFNAFREAMADAGGPPAAEDPRPVATAPVAAPVVAAPGPVPVTRGGTAPVPLTCPVEARRCVGTITIETPPVRKHRRAKKQRLKLGSRHVRIRSGGRKVVMIRIPKRHRALLREMKQVRVRVTVAAGAEVNATRSTKRSALTLSTARIAVR